MINAAHITPSQLVAAGGLIARELGIPLWNGVQVVATAINGGIVCAHKIRPDSSVVETCVWNDRALPFDVAPDKWALIDLMNNEVEGVSVESNGGEQMQFTAKFVVHGELARRVANAVHRVISGRMTCQNDALVFRVTDNERGVVRDADAFGDKAERLFDFGMSVWPHGESHVVIGKCEWREPLWQRISRWWKRMVPSA